MPHATNPNDGAGEPPKPGGFLPFLFGLAPGGVYRASPVTSGAVRSYRTVSPLPSARPMVSHVTEPGRRSVFCGTFPEVTLAGR